ncbi:hydrogenase maturation protease [bacterium]|nr:hydrogenase maturation protease [bacterium]
MNFNEFQESLHAYSPKSIVLVGLGNPMRTDDGAGLKLLEKIKQTDVFSASHFIFAETNPENYLQNILDCHPEAVVFIDTARFKQPPGTIQWLKQYNLEEFRISTHAFSMTLVEEYLRAHQSMSFYYLGIQPYSTKIGRRMSSVLKRSLELFFLK